jgi:tetratricopeptide (TPR) repeat protein
MVVLSHLELGDMDAVRAAHDTMVDLFPTNKFTGAAATKIFNTLLARRDAAQKAGDDARATELARDMARYIHLGNELDPTPNFVNLRTESTLWKELGEHEQAEDVLESLVRRFADDPERKNDLERFVKPDLGEVLLAQKRAQEAFDVLDELVPDPEDASDPRKPSSRVVESWCRAVCGWVESDPEGKQITPVPGVGGAEHLEDACTYWNKLLDAAKANPGAWTQPWYERYFETAYGYYQWGQVDSERLNTARAQLELLRTELGDDLGMLEDEGLRKRLLWLWGKVR